ncbi:hypothetical protein [Aquiflexum sp.]|uniref:hypothetical protein n=1 Tax=Aquiflexum sp. TaxID=1872584 RepID=UPI0035931A03
MKKLNYFLLAILTTAFFSCIEDKLPDFSECKDSGSLSHLQTELLGTWEWQFIMCCPESNEGMKKDSNAYLGTKITFFNDGTGKKEDKSGIEDFSWSLKTVDTNYFGIDSDPVLHSIFGRLFICNDNLWANDSYRDGADNYFNKIIEAQMKPK